VCSQTRRASSRPPFRERTAASAEFGLRSSHRYAFSTKRQHVHPSVPPATQRRRVASVGIKRADENVIAVFYYIIISVLYVLKPTLRRERNVVFRRFSTSVQVR